MDTVYLFGSEDVRRASSTILQAAEEMKRAAANIQYALESHQGFLTQWLQEYRDLLIPPEGSP